MAGTRIEKYQSYRNSIINSNDVVPALKTPHDDEKFSSEMGYFKKIVLKRRVFNSLILLSIIAIITVLVIFGIIIF